MKPTPPNPPQRKKRVFSLTLVMMIIVSPMVVLSSMLAFAPTPVASLSPGQPLSSLGKIMAAAALIDCPTTVTSTSQDESYPVVAVDENNIVHVAWVAGSDVYYANNSGGVWNTTRIASGTAYAEYYSPPSIYVAGGTPYVAWADTRNGPNGDGTAWDIYYAKSSDGWVEHLVTSGPTLAVSSPSIAVDSTGNVHISYIRFTVPGGVWPYNHQVFYTNENSGWVEEQVSDTGYDRHYWSSMDVDSNGVVHIAFSNWGDTEHIYYANSSSGWTNIQIDSNPTTNWWDDRINPCIAVDSSDVVHIAWEDRRNTDTSASQTPNRVEIYYANSSSGWTNQEIALPQDSANLAKKQEPSIAIDGSGTIHAVWSYYTSYNDYYPDLYYSNSNDWNTSVNITNMPEGTSIYLVSTQEALCLDSSSRWHVVWADRRNGNYDIFYGNASNLPEPPAAPENVPENVLTALSISPSSFTLQSGSSTTLTATLKDNANNAIASKTITWGATSGSVSPSSGATNSYGQVSATYTAPSVTAQTSVTVTASFAGDDNYQASSGTSSGTITVAAAPTLENFEDVSDWTWVDNGSNCSGSQSADWWTNGSYSYKIYCYTPVMYGGYYGGIKRAFDFTGVNNITVDILLRQTTDYGTGQVEAQVLIGDNVVWSKPYPSGSGTDYYVNTVIDTSGYTGVENLTFRWYCTLNPGSYSGSPITIDYYIDRLRTGVDTALLTTSISISPSSFTLNSGGSTQLNATLTSSGSPLPDKTSLSWSATSGSITQTGYSSSGTVFTICANYTAPTVTAQTSVTITASFAGDNQYQASSGTSSGTITVLENVPENALPTTISISPSSFTLQSGGSTTLTATLKDNADNALANKTITWSATSGGVSPSSGVTDASGQVSVTYSAPTVTSQTSVTVTASFAGDNQYQASSGYSYGTITVPENVVVLTTLVVAPSSFTLYPSGLRVLTATLKDGANNPITNKTITWSAAAGTLSATSATTDSYGQASVAYTAPSYETTVTVTVSFAGDAQYLASSGVSSGTVAKASTTLTVTPSTFTLQPGNSTTLTAILTSAGAPLVGKTLSWSATQGGVVPSSGTTDSLGRVSVTYAAPSYEDNVVVTATFTGDDQYRASSGSSSGKIESALPLQAVVEIKPDTLQIGSAGEWVTCYIELPDDNVSQIDVSSILLEGTIQVDNAAPTEIGDNDSDNVPDLMVKFNRASVENIVTLGPVTLTVTGSVGESTFTGADKIDVIKTGPGALASARSENLGETPEVREEVYDPNLVVAAEAGDNKVTVSVSSAVSTGTTIVVNVDNTVVPLSSLDELVVLFDNENIELADDYDDVLDTTDENDPEYLVLFGAEGVQVLVSIPSFSDHTVTIRNVVAAAETPPPEEAVTPPAEGIPLAALLAIVSVVLMVLASAAWVGIHQARGEATSELIEHGLYSMRLQEVDIFREIRGRKEFTIPELIHETGASNTLAWRTIQKLIKKGLVKPTKNVKPPATARGKPSRVYEYVGD